MIEISSTMLDRWHKSDSHPKTGQWELLSSPDCELSPGILWDVAVLTAVRNMKTSKWLVQSGNLAILVPITLLLLNHL